MEWLLLVLAGGGAAAGARRLALRRASRREQEQELEDIRRLADEDVTLLGEQLRRLDAEVAGRDLDADARTDYQQALDAYESAQRATSRLRDPEQVSTITDTLATGRYALACVQARVAGRDLPVRRVPCFFNPQHGPSVTDVVWTRPRHGTRKVPACAQDAARVSAGEQPEVRTIRVGARTVPYWEAGTAYLPYSYGYFPAATSVVGANLEWGIEPGPSAGSHGAPGQGTGQGADFSGADGSGADLGGPGSD